MSVYVCSCYLPASFVHCFPVGATLLQKLAEKVAQCAVLIFARIKNILNNACKGVYKKFPNLCISAGIFLKDKITQILSQIFPRFYKTETKASKQKTAEEILKIFRSENWGSPRFVLQQAIDLHKTLLTTEKLEKFKEFDCYDEEFICLASRWAVRTLLFKANHPKGFDSFPSYLDRNQKSQLLNLILQFNRLLEKEKQKIIYYTGFLEQKDKSQFVTKRNIMYILEKIDVLSFELLSNPLFYNLIPELILNKDSEL